ncbi:hypothetical protein GCM10027280_17260 [Micromonospora polyrhachis]|uniref:Uncharacterized protein n=1 Tax=Micromonospora polyrhachis TaxID=1282883 RepID=A0A7W7SPF8_9ACTN|nr:hypothetical protein [Micromonospora polyrhachis]MBB4958386.1 hypothetical protein [Micromonospora polyrhachis]
MQNGSYYMVERPAFTARFLLGNGPPESVQDADVHVHLTDGSVRYLTFFTLPAIERVLQRQRTSGETAGGAYFWSTDLVIIPEPGVAAMARALEELVQSKDIEAVGQLIRGELQNDG